MGPSSGRFNGSQLYRYIVSITFDTALVWAHIHSLSGTSEMAELPKLNPPAAGSEEEISSDCALFPSRICINQFPSQLNGKKVCPSQTPSSSTKTSACCLLIIRGESVKSVSGVGGWRLRRWEETSRNKVSLRHIRKWLQEWSYGWYDAWVGGMDS